MLTTRTPACLLASLLSNLLVTAALSAQTLTFTSIGSIPAPVEAIRVQGNHAYVGAGRTLTIYDVTNPAAPKREGSYTFPEEIWSFRVYGTHVYVGANFFGLGILDVSNPSSPVLRGSFKTPGQAKTAAVVGSKVAVIDHMEGLVFVDASNVVKPVGAGTFFLDGYGRDVTASGRYAYAVDSPTGFYVLDLSKPGPLEPVSSVQSGTGLRTIEVSESLAVLVGGGSLQPYDISNPAAPVKAPPFRTPGGAQRVALQGTRAYVADGREGLQVVDFSVLSKPVITGAHKTATAARDVAVSGPLVFMLIADPNGRPQDPGSVVILRQAP
jgi:hypothetical protein